MVQVVAVLIEHLSRASRKGSAAESFPAEPNFPLDVIPDPHDTPQGTRIPWGLDHEQILLRPAGLFGLDLNASLGRVSGHSPCSPPPI